MVPGPCLALLLLVRPTTHVAGRYDDLEETRMTNRTRRRLTFCLVLGLITLPAEALLFPVAPTPEPRAAAERWVDSRTPDALHSASRNIENYPALYRRAIMAELAPSDRSQVWRTHFSRYVDAHPNMTPDQLAVLNEAMAIATPD